MLSEKIIFVGVIVNLFCSLWYIRNIFRGNTQPNLVSWFIWALAPMVGTFLALRAGAGFSVLGIFMAGFGPLLVIIFSFFKRNAFWKIQSFDLVCGFFSILALIIYLLTKNLSMAISFAIFSDFLAYVPTFIKSWKYPETETSSVYWGGVFNNFLALLIIDNWNFAIYAFPIYLIMANLIEIIFLYRKRKFLVF